MDKKPAGPLKVLSLSDTLVRFVYSPQVRSHFKNIDLIIGCGDLEYYYLEFVLTALNAPLFYVRGNHDKVVEYSGVDQRTAPGGGTDLHRRVGRYKGWLLAGVEGSLRYRFGQFQYTQAEMWKHVFSLVPGLLYNRLVYGRFLDVFVTHAPPAGIHDRDDLTHQGINAFRWLIRVFQPAYHFHGHIHIYRPDEVTETLFGSTRVINTFSYRETILDLNSRDHSVPTQTKTERPF
jgi:Icc-related predicted phosphoesterase